MILLPAAVDDGLPIAKIMFETFVARVPHDNNSTLLRWAVCQSLRGSISLYLCGIYRHRRLKRGYNTCRLCDIPRHLVKHNPED